MQQTSLRLAASLIADRHAAAAEDRRAILASKHREAVARPKWVRALGELAARLLSGYGTHPTRRLAR